MISVSSRRLSSLVGLLMALLWATMACAGEQVTSDRVSHSPPSASRADLQVAIASWHLEFEAIRAEAVPMLMSMADYSVYLPTVASRTSLRTPDELDWDLPASPTWKELGPLLAPLNRRAALLHRQVAAPSAAVTDWRGRRALAEATHQLLTMTERMLDYYSMTSKLAEHDDGGSTRDLVAAARHDWNESVSKWQIAVVEAR